MSTQPRSKTVFFGRQWSEFDLLLAAIPLMLLGGIVSASLLSVPLFVGIAVGAGLAGCLVGYGMYAITRLQSTPTEPEPQFPRQSKRLN